MWFDCNGVANKYKSIEKDSVHISANIQSVNRGVESRLPSDSAMLSLQWKLSKWVCSSTACPLFTADIKHDELIKSLGIIEMRLEASQ